MGYTHYWRRPEKLDADLFKKASQDVHAVVKKLKEIGLELAGPDGNGSALVSGSVIAFNGKEHCGHRERDLGITWPAHNKETGGIGTKTAGHWFAGATLQERTCGGDCSQESFFWEVNETMPDYQKEDGEKLLFNFCKTAYKPYDLAVTAALIVLDHYFGNTIKISSDGEDKDFRDGAMFCQMVLGYGANYKLPLRGDA